MIGNCYLFALYRLWTRGGYVVSCRSRYGWWLHAMWTPDLERFEEFAPRKRPYRRRVPPILFRGYVRHFMKAKLAR